MVKRKHRKTKQKVVEVDLPELRSLVERSRTLLGEEDGNKLEEAVAVLTFLLEELQRKNTSIAKLRRMLFGEKTEKTSRVLGEEKSSERGEAKEKSRAKPPGHGRLGAAAYTGAQRVPVPHPTLKAGDCCEACGRGKIYSLSEPSPVVRVTGMAPFAAKIWECERLRCNACGKVHTAKTPEGVGDKKFDESVAAMAAVLKYGTGMTFHRIEKLQAAMGIPFPAATQWQLVKEAADDLEPAFAELVYQAAQGDVLHNDDTRGRILELSVEQRQAMSADSETENRTGVFTTGIVSKRGKETMALFLTGPKHAGENLADVLSKRAAELAAPIQMSDALPANTSSDFETIYANCNSHARRNFVNVVDAFPEECRFVVETFRRIYCHDAEARDQKLDDDERLELHQARSGPLMEALRIWMQRQVDKRLVEPNSGLGKAIKYMQRHWDKLTLFLRVPGAPLDNNICERALKKAILHRKNSLFYKTPNGARVGDIFMSFIHTAELNGVGPFRYLVTLLKHRIEVARSPADWMPWNFQQSEAMAQPSVASG